MCLADWREFFYTQYPRWSKISVENSKPTSGCTSHRLTDRGNWYDNSPHDVQHEHGLTSAPTQYRLYGRRFLQVRRPNQQYLKEHRILNLQKNTIRTHKHKTANPLVYNNMGWLGDGSHRGQGCHCQAWTAVGLPLRYHHDVQPNNELECRSGPATDNECRRHQLPLMNY